MIKMTAGDPEELNKALRRLEKREKIVGGILSCVRIIVYTPLGIAFNAVSFVAKIVGFLSAFGLIPGVYLLYKSVMAVIGGTPFGEVNTFEKAGTLIIVPFIAYTIAVIAERIHDYFEDNAF